MLSFSTDLIIKGSKAKKYQELKIKYGFEYIDTLIISATLGFINGCKGIQENDTEDAATIPRTVLISHSDIIEEVCEYIVLSEDLEMDEEKALKTAFADVSQKDSKRLEKVERFIDYSYGGIDILYDELTSDKYADAVDGMKSLLDKYLDKSSISRETREEIFERYEK